MRKLIYNIGKIIYNIGVYLINKGYTNGNSKDVDRTYWNYRVLVEEGEEPYFYLAEVYYTNDKAEMSSEAITISGESIKDIQWQLNNMRVALNKPILYSGDRFPEEFKFKEYANKDI